jgi:hypothetical protein
LVGAGAGVDEGQLPVTLRSGAGDQDDNEGFRARLAGGLVICHWVLVACLAAAAQAGEPPPEPATSPSRLTLGLEVVDERPQRPRFGPAQFGTAIRPTLVRDPTWRSGWRNGIARATWVVEGGTVADAVAVMLETTARAEGLRLLRKGLPEDSPRFHVVVRSLWCKPVAAGLGNECETVLEPTLIEPTAAHRLADIAATARAGPLQSRPFEDIREALAADLGDLFRGSAILESGRGSVPPPGSPGSPRVGELIRLRPGAFLFSDGSAASDRARSVRPKWTNSGLDDAHADLEAPAFELIADRGEFLEVRRAAMEELGGPCRAGFFALRALDLRLFVRRSDILRVLAPRPDFSLGDGAWVRVAPGHVLVPAPGSMPGAGVRVWETGSRRLQVRALLPPSEVAWSFPAPATPPAIWQEMTIKSTLHLPGRLEGPDGFVLSAPFGPYVHFFMGDPGSVDVPDGGVRGSDGCIELSIPPGKGPVGTMIRSLKVPNPSHWTPEKAARIEEARARIVREGPHGWLEAGTRLTWPDGREAGNVTNAFSLGAPARCDGGTCCVPTFIEVPGLKYMLSSGLSMADSTLEVCFARDALNHSPGTDALSSVENHLPKFDRFFQRYDPAIHPGIPDIIVNDLEALRPQLTDIYDWAEPAVRPKALSMLATAQVDAAAAMSATRCGPDEKAEDCAWFERWRDGLATSWRAEARDGYQRAAREGEAAGLGSEWLAEVRAKLEAVPLD